MFLVVALVAVFGHVVVVVEMVVSHGFDPIGVRIDQVE